MPERSGPRRRTPLEAQHLSIYGDLIVDNTLRSWLRTSSAIWRCRIAPSPRREPSHNVQSFSVRRAGGRRPLRRRCDRHADGAMRPQGPGHRPWSLRRGYDINSRAGARWGHAAAPVGLVATHRRGRHARGTQYGIPFTAKTSCRWGSDPSMGSRRFMRRAGHCWTVHLWIPRRRPERKFGMAAHWPHWSAILTIVSVVLLFLTTADSPSQ